MAAENGAAAGVNGGVGEKRKLDEEGDIARLVVGTGTPVKIKFKRTSFSFRKPVITHYPPFKIRNFAVNM